MALGDRMVAHFFFFFCIFGVSLSIRETGANVAARQHQQARRCVARGRNMDPVWTMPCWRPPHASWLANAVMFQRI